MSLQHLERLFSIKMNTYNFCLFGSVLTLATMSSSEGIKDSSSRDKKEALAQITLYVVNFASHLTNPLGVDCLRYRSIH